MVKLSFLLMVKYFHVEVWSDDWRYLAIFGEENKPLASNGLVLIYYHYCYLLYRFSKFNLNGYLFPTYDILRANMSGMYHTKELYYVVKIIDCS